MGCSNAKFLKSENSKPIHPDSKAVVENNQPMRKIMVFKPYQDVYNLVPVRLSQDKKEVLSYPAASDLPDLGIQKLENGYLLDLIGVNENTAYLNITINEYKTSSRSFSLKELKSNIGNVNPYLELYECQYDSIKTSVNEALNQWIKIGALNKKCKQIIIPNK